MALMRKRDKFKQWISNPFALKDKMRDKPDGPTSLISHAQGFAINNSHMTSVQGNQYTTYVQGDRNIVPQIMKLLSDHIIQGAAHDSSVRTPPPRCHPDTRVKIIARIAAWFNGQAQRELILWITGPAGVGKSAIVQTFAEYLIKLESLGASVFISRPNKRNNPHGIFVTVAYQLATRIEAYRNFIVERLSLDPELLRGNMQTQFKTFIVEPFVEKKIGAGGKRWGILLDGLDELQGEDAQCQLIQLISAFVQEYSDVPLLWMISSRQEPRISNTFADPEVYHSHWSEYVPIDSTKACKDVELFLRSSFDTMQKNFRESVPSDWPSDTNFLNLTVAASGLFIYAEVVVRFIGDSDYADPVSRFEAVLSVIARSAAGSTNPFVHLDALYHEILSFIQPTQWPTTKRLLGLLSHRHSSTLTFQSLDTSFMTPVGISVLFSLSQHTIFACLAKCRSILRIPDHKAAHKEKLTVLHASFTDYLKDADRSEHFHVGKTEDVGESVILNILLIWNKCSGDNVATVESMWHQYCSKLDNKTPSTDVVDFHAELFQGIVHCLARMACTISERPADSLTYAQLCKVDMAKLCYYFQGDALATFVINLQCLPTLGDMTLTRETRLRELKFGHLDWGEMSPANAHDEPLGGPPWEKWVLRRPRSSVELAAFVSELEYLREQLPELKVVIFGGIPEGRVAAFHRLVEKGLQDVYYVIPYPE